MTKVKHEAMEAFLAELSALSRRHGLYIDGCGCCGSPYVYASQPLEAGPGAYTIDEGGNNLGWRRPE
jgi:hypothetical protein